MKKNIALCLVFFSSLPVLQAGTDTTILGVNINSAYSQTIFPDSWLNSRINANGEQITGSEQMRVEPIIILALKKYPEDVLKNNLKFVHLLKKMEFFNVGFGGTNSSTAVYITANGEEAGYTTAYIEQTFHHEFSSILFRNYTSLLDTTTWKLQNEPGFNYNDPDAGVGAIKNKQSGQSLHTNYAEKGMLTQYAMSSLENDINTIAQNLFRPSADFWLMADNYQRVGKKVNLLIEFYNKIDPAFTEQYFMNFNLH
jgi:hypothetical protein